MRLQQVYEKFKDRADFYWVYIREAHASDSARPSPNVVIPTHRTAAEREKAATGCQATLALKAPVLVDDMQDTVARAFNGWPDRLFLLSKEGKIAYRGGLGPWGLNVAEMEAALAKELGAPPPVVAPTEATPAPAAVRPMGSPALIALDLNGDGTLTAEELAKATESLRKLDRNHDGRLTADEYRPQGR